MSRLRVHIRGVVGVLAFAALALTGCDDPSEGVQETVAQEVKVVTEVASGSQEYALDIKSSVLSFTGTKEPGVSHSGGWTDYNVTVSIPDGDFTKASITIEIDINSMYTDAKALTETMLSDKMFDGANYPKATFQSTGIEQKGDVYAVSGNLNIHGVEKNITFEADVSVSESQVTAESEFNLNRKDFEINYDGLAGALIRDKVVMLFYVVANAE